MGGQKAIRIRDIRLETRRGLRHRGEVAPPNPHLQTGRQFAYAEARPAE
jgi:hypothetical protein